MSVRAQTDLQPGDELLGYRVERVIGRGGMGVVYLAEQLVLDRLVALKLLAPELAENTEFRERFLRESRLAASLDHPNIVPVFDAGEVDGRLYIAMRYVEGHDLGELLAGHDGPLEPERAIALLAPVADALDAAHAKGLVHRDVKPSNVLVDQSKRSYLADFGLTKESSEKGLVEQSHFAASVEYVAPEQIEGKPVDGRADQYALACVLYECLTGATPFANGTTMATLWGHLDGEPPKASDSNPELPNEIDTVFERALAKHPEKRYPTCTDLTDAARHALGLEQTPRLLRPRWLAAIAAALLLIVAAGVVGGVLAFGGGESTPKPDLSVRDDSVVRIDPETGEVAAVIDVGKGPRDIAVSGGSVWVYNTADRTVSEIDRASDSILQTLAVAGRAPIETFNEVVVAADAEGAWVVTETGLGRGLLTHLRPAPLVPVEHPLDFEPHSVAVGEGWVWVTARSLGRGHLLRIDPRTGSVDTAIEIDWPERLVVAEGAVWTVTRETQISSCCIITRRDPETLEPMGMLPVRGRDDHPAFYFNVGSGALWMHGTQASPLRIFDAKTLNQIGTTPVPSDVEVVAVGSTDGAVWLIESNASGQALGGTGQIGLRRLDRDSHERQTEFALSLPARPGGSLPAPMQATIAADSIWITIGG